MSSLWREVPGLPGVRVEVLGSTGDIFIDAPAGIRMHEPAQVAALQQALEQARVDQARIHRDLYPEDGKS